MNGKRFRIKYARHLADAISDFLTLSVGWLLFNIIRFYSLPLGFSQDIGTWLMYPVVRWGQLLFPLGMVLLYAVSGCYNKSVGLLRSRLDQCLNTLLISAIGMLSIFFIALLNDLVPERLANYELMLILFACLALPTLIVRLIVSTIRTNRVLSGEGQQKAIIAWVSPEKEAAVSRLVDSARKIGYTVIAVHDDGALSGASSFCGISTRQGELTKLVEEVGAKAIILPVVSFDDLGDSRRTDSLFRLGIPVFISPSRVSLLAMRPQLNTVRTEPLVDITSANVGAATWNLKRIGDIVGSLFALITLSPIFFMLAVAIKLDSRGPVFYRQIRVGYRRKPFKIIKFRSMRVDAEKDGPALSSEKDERITRVGRWLRKYRMDELPQFWNVLVGQMSIVGPRPERPYFANQILEKKPVYSLMHQVRPGITSWGMVKYGYASNVDQMVERLSYDLLYLQNISLAIDLKILLLTISTVITGRGV